MDSAETATEGTPVKAAELQRGFVTLFFDDLHLSTSDAMLSRQAATKLFGAMQPGERLAIFSTSGQVQQEFTADREKLDDALQRIVPHSLSGSSGADCPPMTFYEAYQIVEARDPVALQVATRDAARWARSHGARSDSSATRANNRRIGNTVLIPESGCPDPANERVARAAHHRFDVARILCDAFHA